MRKSLTIDGVTISDDSECYVIAEIGHNHQGDVEKCKELFRKAKEAGASAVKLQKRDNRSLFTKAMYNQVYDNPNSFGETYGQHREFLEFNKDQYRELMAFAKELGITMFSTAFDIPSADFLEDLGMPAYKLASGDLKNTPLLRHVAKFKKPMIISTGGAMMEDVKHAVETILPINDKLAVLQCTAGYPPEYTELNLNVIKTFREAFPQCVIGYSGHDSGIAMSVVAYVLGARIIEKHFTLNRAMKGTDHAFSLEPVGLRKVVRDLQRAREALGDGVKKTYPSEQKPIMKMGKKLVAAKNLPEGHKLGPADIAMKSPCDGLSPAHFDSLIGKTLRRSLAEDEAFSLDFVK